MVVVAGYVSGVLTENRYPGEGRKIYWLAGYEQ